MAKPSLASRKCRPLPPGTPALTPRQIAALLRQVPGWEVVGGGGAGTGELTRIFKFQNYHQSMAFVNATAWISHAQDHHPDIELGYNTVTMRYSTHSVGGLSENDFICAAKVSLL